MVYFIELKSLADELDCRGFTKRANLIDSYLLKLAQDAVAPSALEAPTGGALPPLGDR